MTLTAPPLPDSRALTRGRCRRDRLIGAKSTGLHPVLERAYLAARDRLADMRLPEGGGLMIGPAEGYGLVHSRIGSRPIQLCDVFPSEEPLGEPPRLFQRLRGWLGIPGRVGATALLRPTGAGRFASLSDGQQSFIVDLGGLLAGWPMAVWFAEMARLLKPGGVYLCVSLGPTSLAPLWDALGRPVPASPFWYDLHDLGDAMASAGLAAPVAESDRLTFSYRQTEQAWADIRDFPVRPHRSSDHMGGQGDGFLGHRACRQVWAALESQRGEDGRIALGVELVLVHAWKPEPRQQAGSGRADPAQTVTWHPRRAG